jgi:hypothetical protein
VFLPVHRGHHFVELTKTNMNSASFDEHKRKMCCESKDTSYFFHFWGEVKLPLRAQSENDIILDLP